MRVTTSSARAAAPIGFVVLISCLAGCGGDGSDENRVTVYPVTGKVTMAGAPVADAAVMFSPQGEQPTAAGRTNTDGEFTLTTYEAGDGAAAGEYTVVVTKTAAGPGLDPEQVHAAEAAGGGTTAAGHGAAQAESGSALPSRYASPAETPLKATVGADAENHFEFPLEAQ